MSATKIKTLGEVALDLLFGPHKFTDLHIESDEPVMIRRATADWVPVKTDDNAAVIFTHREIMAFLHGMFTGSAGVPPYEEASEKWPTWLVELHKRGAIHHATQLNRDEAKAAVEEGRSLDGLTCRVRCTVQLQSMRERIGLVMRPLKKVPDNLNALGLPLQLSRMLINASNGLIVVTGPTGSGKSTTLAAMVNEINAARAANILTLEDPIEFIHDRKKSIINQRELGLDVVSFESGVTDALRFVPDVILIGEIRDANTMRAAIRAAESGHLVLTSTHAPTTVGAVRKMLSYLSESDTASQDLGGCLVGVLAQSLIRGKTDSGECHLAYELLNARDVQTASAIQQGASRLESYLKQGQTEGYIGMIQSVRHLVKEGKVEPRRAAAVLFDPQERAEMLKLAQAQGDGDTRAPLPRPGLRTPA